MPKHNGEIIVALFQKKSKPDLVGDLEAEIGELRKTGDSLESRRERLAHSLAEAEAASRAALLADDDAQVEKAAASVAAFESQLRAIAAALAEQRQKVSDAEAAVATAKSRAAREAKAQALDEQAAKIKALSAEYFEIAEKFCGSLVGVENCFENSAVAAMVLDSARGVKDVRLPSLLLEIQQTAAQLRADPPPHLPNPPPPPEPSDRTWGKWQGPALGGVERPGGFGYDSRPHDSLPKIRVPN